MGPFTLQRFYKPLLFFVLVAPAACQTSPKTSQPKSLTVVLKSLPEFPVEGQFVLTEIKRGQIELQGTVKGLSEGAHGFHIHENSDCSSSDFSSAGGHFNPEKTAHGALSGQPRHQGDLGNLVADKTKNASIKITFTLADTLDGLDGLIGRSLVIHEKSDDLKSQPAGNAGKRIACGPIQL